MAHAAEAFDEHRRGNVFRSISGGSRPVPDAELPYSKVRTDEMPPMMFQLRLRDGQIVSFAYSDLREIRLRDAGYIELGVYAMNKLRITLEGRNLRELAALLGSAMIRWIEEANERESSRPENAAEVVRVCIEKVTD